MNHTLTPSTSSLVDSRESISLQHSNVSGHSVDVLATASPLGSGGILLPFSEDSFVPMATKHTTALSHPGGALTVSVSHPGGAINSESPIDTPTSWWTTSVSAFTTADASVEKADQLLTDQLRDFGLSPSRLHSSMGAEYHPTTTQQLPATQRTQLDVILTKLEQLAKQVSHLECLMLQQRTDPLYTSVDTPVPPVAENATSAYDRAMKVVK